MAILVYAEKIDETDTSVVYSYGKSVDNKDRTLTFDKATRQPDLGEEQVTPFIAGACKAVLKQLKDSGEWPDHGMYAA